MNGEINGIAMSGGLIHGQHIQSGTAYPYPTGAALVSGNVQSGHVGSGVIQGAAGTTRHIASGTLDFFDFAPSAVDTATIENNAVKSGKIGSGAVGGYWAPTRHIASGTVGSFDFGSGAVMAGQVGSGAVQRANLASGVISRDKIEDGAVNELHLNTSSVISGKIASAAVSAANIASGQINTNHLASGLQTAQGQVIKWLDTTELISGQRAVMWASGGYPRIKSADPRSGRYTPVVGVTLSGGVSGASVAVVVHGPVPWSASGMMASGFHGDPVFAGSGGTVVMASGTFAGGASSGGGIRTLSGMVACGVGTIHSGMVYVSPANTIISQSGNTIARRGFVF